jgi:hypothetical protein
MLITNKIIIPTAVKSANPERLSLFTGILQLSIKLREMNIQKYFSMLSERK